MLSVILLNVVKIGTSFEMVQFKSFKKYKAVKQTKLKQQYTRAIKLLFDCLIALQSPQICKKST